MRYLEAGLLIAAQTVGPAYSVRVVDLGQGSVVRPFELPADSCGLSRKEITRQLEQSIVTTVSAEVAAPRLPRISFRRTTSSVASDDPFERMDTTIQAKFSRPLPTSGSSLQVVFVHPGSGVYSGVAQFRSASRTRAVWKSIGDWRSDVIAVYLVTVAHSVAVDCHLFVESSS